MSVKDDLMAVRELIKHPAHWTQHTAAMNEEGLPVYPESSDAVQFCLLGALSRVAGEECRRDLMKKALYKYTRSITHYNDTNSHDDVIALLDKVIGEL